MKILIPYYSRTGNTKRLAETLAGELKSRGHIVDMEEILAVKRWNKWLMVIPLLPIFPALPLFLGVATFRRWWLKTYRQQEQAIQPLSHPDVSGYDLICLGGPKWLYVSFPIARYLSVIKGMEGKLVGSFSTFCGPPLEAFEIEMLFSPLQDRIEKAGGRVVSVLAVSSQYHEFFFFNEMEWIFRLVSRLAFNRSLKTFALDSEWGRQEVQRFCDSLDCSARLAS